MKSWIWLRVQAVILGVFALGHTLGTAVPRITRGATQAIVVDAMQHYQFPIMGIDRSYWDFYRGFALAISLLLAAAAVIAWQIAPIAKRDPRGALPLAVTLAFVDAGMLVLSCRFFFTGPIVFAALALGCQGVVLAALVRER